MSDKKMHKKANLRAVVIGAGRIGAMFDRPGQKEIITHAHAYTKAKNVSLVGVFDVDPTAARKAARRWGVPALLTWDEVVKARPDMASVCVPDAVHSKVLRQLAAVRPRLVVCEKPVADTLDSTREIYRLYTKRNIPVLVNYSYLFHPDLIALRAEISESTSDVVLSATGTYTKGLLHNGSHMLSIAHYLFGELRFARFLYKRNDASSKDASVSAFMQFRDCPQFHLVIGDARDYAIFELDVLLRDKRYRFTDSVFTAWRQTAGEDAVFKGFTTLRPPLRLSEFRQPLARAITNGVNYLNGKERLVCTLKQALLIQESCEKLRILSSNTQRTHV